MTSPGGSFNLTREALAQAERDYYAAADAVQLQFKRLRDAVLDNPSRGDAFNAAHNVALQLDAEAKRFRDITTELAGNVNLSARNYQNNNDAGAASINAVAGAINSGGASYDRLVRG